MTTLLSLAFSIGSILLQDTGKIDKISDVTITASQKKESDASLVTTQRKSLVVMDVMSSESIKRTPDRTVGDVLKRVGGTSVQDDKYVVVRGLTDRYNLVLINGALIGSTEPDRKSFSFDLIGSNMIDNLTITKTSSPNIPGEFSGGVIKLTTKIADSKMSSIDFGLGYGSLTTFKNSLTVKSCELPQNFLHTKEYRRLPFDLKLIESQKIDNSFSPIQRMNLPNLRFSYVKGDKLKNFSYLTNFTVRNSNSYETSERTDYMSSTDLMYRYVDDRYVSNLTLSGIANFKYKRFEIKNNINYINQNSFVNRTGVNYDNEQNVFSQSSNNTTKFFYNTQLVGKKFNLNYSLLSNGQPDYRITPKAQNINGGDTVFVWRDSYRFWSSMNEHTVGGTYDDTFKGFKFGFLESFKYRDFSARVFRYNEGFVLDEITNNTDKYSAVSNIISGYVMFDKKYKKLTTSGGVRTENQFFNVYTYNFSGMEEFVNRMYLDLLPSINFIYSYNQRTNFRLSASRTVARPEFREVSNFTYYNFVRNAQVIGNTNLERTKITNIDFRYEFFPTSKELITVSVFTKQFQNPIEQIVDNGSVPSNLILTLSNPETAYLHGAEFEMRKKIFRNIIFYTNVSGFLSSVTSNGRTRQLQGQSPYIINSGLFYNKGNFNLNLLYNRIGERISAVGFVGYNDIYENSRDVIDLTAQYQKNKITIKFGVRDVLAQSSVFYQHIENSANRNLINTNNQQNINISINYKL